MDNALAALLNELHDFGTDNDSRKEEPGDRMLNITPDTGQFLSLLIQATRARRVLEVGTSNGYSTLWMADALRRTGGTVSTVEISVKKALMARANFRRSGLSQTIDLHNGDVRAFLGRQRDRSFDLIFLDADRRQYAGYWDQIDRILRVGGLLVVDNAIVPGPEDLLELINQVESSTRYLTQTLHIGKGEMVSLKLM